MEKIFFLTILFSFLVAPFLLVS